MGTTTGQGPDGALVVRLRDVRMDDLSSVGGKNASLGELIGNLADAGVAVPDGFATTVRAFDLVLSGPGIRDRFDELLGDHREGRRDLGTTALGLRRLLGEAELPEELVTAIGAAYAELTTPEGEAMVAVRSSATAEDLPDASFAGQQETYLGVRGIDGVLEAVRRCFASLYTDRAMSYREQHGFDHGSVALSVGVQRMVRSDVGSAGVLFTVDPETGFPDVVLITSAWGLGESVVAGLVEPDEFTVFTPLLDRDGVVPIVSRTVGAKQLKVVRRDPDAMATASEAVVRAPTTEDERRVLSLGDDDVLVLARWAGAIAEHYGRPMDVEWARDGITGELFIVQARPETVQSQHAGLTQRTYRLTGIGPVLLEGLAVGERIGSGRVRVLTDPLAANDFDDGDVLVTTITDPDWVPVMRKASAIVTEAGGRTSHAAIVSRELGLPAVLGARGATELLSDGDEVTVSCAQGERGLVYAGILPVETDEVDIGAIPTTRTHVGLNLADPSAAFRFWRLGPDGVGLARMEFVISEHVGAHPLALLDPGRLEDDDERAAVEALAETHGDLRDWFVSRISDGVARLAAGAWPHRCIIRLSDFKSNEYAHLLGGTRFEPAEENPMIGWRGASRYVSPQWAEPFALECRALAQVRRDVGLTNLAVMIPFCRTVEEADGVLAAMAAEGLVRGEDGLEVWVMAEIPANVILAEAFAERFDGFSIGSNDLTQLVLGIDRDNDLLADAFDESNPAVTAMIRDLVTRAHAAGRPVGLCGQAPSNRPEFAAFLAEIGIDSVSVTPDAYVRVRQVLADAEDRA
jgi:pyruvate, water dikinase